MQGQIYIKQLSKLKSSKTAFQPKFSFNALKKQGNQAKKRKKFAYKAKSLTTRIKNTR